MKKASKRKINVEVIRVIACLMVIATHIKLSAETDDFHLFTLRTFLGSCAGIGVTIFFLITGFYLYNNKDFGRLFTKTLKSVMLPFLLYLIFEPIFISYFTGENSIIGCIKAGNFKIDNVFQIFSWSISNISYGGHLWYIFSYMEIILFFPLVSLMCNEEEKSIKIRRYFLILILASKFLDDIQKISHLEYGIARIFNPLGMPIAITLIGYELYLKKDSYLKNNKVRWAGLGAYVFSVLAMVFIQMYAKYAAITERVLSYDSVIAIVGAVGISLFFLSFSFDNKYVSVAVGFLGKQTYIVYIVHMLVITKLITRGIRDKVYTHTVDSYGMVGEILFFAIYTILVFVCSVIFTVALKFCFGLVAKAYAKLKEIYVSKMNEEDSKSILVKWGIRAGVILIALIAEFSIYHFKYINDVVSISNRGRVYEQNVMQGGERTYISTASMSKKIDIVPVNNLAGVGVNIMRSPSLAPGTIITLTVTSEGNELLNQSIDATQLNPGGDFWQCFFSEKIMEPGSYDVSVKVTGDTELVNVCVLENETSSQELFLIRNESTAFVQKTAKLYWGLIGALTVVVICGVFIETDKRKKKKESK